MKNNALTGCKIAVIGLGHVGLPTALGLAEAGWNVLGADDNSEIIAQVQNGLPPFYEPDLEETLKRHLRSGSFLPSEDLREAILQCDVLFVCVGTPQGENGAADLSQVELVARTIARNLNGYKLIVEKSTTPVRTAERIKQTLLRYGNGKAEVDVAVNPEFLQEGSALHDVLHPDRVVLGVESERVRQILEGIYRPLLDRLPLPGECERCDVAARSGGPEQRLLVTDLNTAEIIKHAANAFLATRVSFANMVADLCEATGADITKVTHAIGLDPRIGPHFLRAGVGYGGYCLPKDVQAFIRIADEHGVNFSILRAAAQINEGRINRFCEMIRQKLWVIRGKTIGVLGLAFKPGTDDIREAPSLKILARLLAEGASLHLHDPQAMDNVQRLFPAEPGRVVHCSSAYEAAAGAHALCLLTEWDEYLALDLAKVHRSMEVPILFDGRNFYDPETMRGLGFEYISVGRP